MLISLIFSILLQIAPIHNPAMCVDAEEVNLLGVVSTRHVLTPDGAKHYMSYAGANCPEQIASLYAGGYAATESAPPPAQVEAPPVRAVAAPVTAQDQPLLPIWLTWDKLAAFTGIIAGLSILASVKVRRGRAAYTSQQEAAKAIDPLDELLKAFSS